MSITMNEKQGLFTLHTKSSTYQMTADLRGTLLHLYYGGRTDDSDHSYLVQYHDVGFSGRLCQKSAHLLKIMV